MLRILLVDDEPLVLIGLQGMLEWEKLGYTVCGTARNGKLALELIEREKPDIVVADVKMPLMDGLTLARTCRERGPLPAFIMLTSFEEFDYIKQAMGAGVVVNDNAVLLADVKAGHGRRGRGLSRQARPDSGKFAKRSGPCCGKGQKRTRPAGGTSRAGKSG